MYYAVGKAFGGDATVRLRRPGRVVGVAVVVAEDLAPVVAGFPLDADQVFGGDLVPHVRGVPLAVHRGDHAVHVTRSLAVAPEQHAAHLEGIAGARVAEDLLHEDPRDLHLSLARE